MTSRGSVEATLRVSENLEAIEVMTSLTSLTQPLIIYWQGVRELSLVSVVRFEHVRTLFDSTQSQESKSEVCATECGNAH